MTRTSNRIPSFCLLAILWTGATAAATAAPRPDPGDDPGCLARAKALLLGDPAKSSAVGDGYDVHSYRLALDLDPDATTYDGEVLVRYVPGPEGLAQLVLDCAGPTVLSASDGTGALDFYQGDDAVTINVPAKRAAALDSVIVAFRSDLAVREGDGLSLWWWDVDAMTQPLISSFSEPEFARTWWPCKDRPDDKATCEVALTVPADMTAVSNGALAGNVDNGDGTRTFTWRESHPIATYLVSVAASDYAHFGGPCTTQHSGSVALDNWVYVDDLAAAQTDFEPLCDMIRYLEHALDGPYPFADEKYGHAEFLNLGSGAMENQTVTSYGRSLITGSNSKDWVVVHELAHQWFGDALTPRTWADIWLNEGFATYSESLWQEHLHAGDPDSLRYYLADIANKRWADDWIGASPVYDPFPVLDRVVYDKGAWILHMLRGRMGDDGFFALLAAWPQGDRLYNVVDTDEFIALATDFAGEDLTGFFRPWLDATTVPHVAMTTGIEDGPDGAGTRLTVRLQDSSGVTFDNVFPLRVTTAAGTQWRTLRLVGASDERTWDFASAVDSVALDPQHWVAWRPAAATEVAFRLVRSTPNPSFNGVTQFYYRLESDASPVLEIFDARGRRLRRRELGPVAASLDEREIIWNGRDDDGRPLSSGVFWARLTAGGRSTVLKFSIVR